MKRFYTLVTAAKTPGGAFEIHLDGKPVKTPAKKFLQTPHESLANEIVKEWAGQGEKIEPHTMPLTQILNTQIDKVTEQRSALSEQTFKYIDTDLIFYRTTYPEVTAHAQKEKWDPVIEYASRRFENDFTTTTDLVALKQDDKAHVKIKSYINDMTQEQFTAFQLIVPLTGSILTTIMFLDGEISPQEVIDIIRAEEHVKDEVYGSALHGQDPMLEKSEKAIMAELEAARHYLSLLATE